ncbi:Spc97/Spc98 family protein, partial [Wuchereria bancrofti]
YAKKAERSAKLRLANANTSTTSITPISRRRTTRFALSHSTTPSTGNSEESFFSPEHVQLLSPQTSALTGRAAHPSVLSEDELTRHVLMALQGIEGTYIVCRDHRHAELQLGKMFAIDDTLRFQLLRLLSIASAYLHLQHQSQKPSSDRLVLAFYTGLSEVLSSYMNLVSMLYTKYMSNRGSFTCLDVLVALSNWEILLPLFSKFILTFDELKGMHVFNMLCSFYWSISNKFITQFLHVVLRPMVYIFHECLHSWLVYGRLMDPVDDRVAKQMGCGKNWLNEYIIVDDAVPIIFQQFEGLKEKIFVVGKSVTLLNLMGMEDDDLHERQRIFSSVDPLKCYLFVSAGHHLWRTVKKLCYQMSGKVSRNIVQKYNFHAHIMAIEQHYLLSDENFALIFYTKLMLGKTSNNSDMLKLNSDQVSDAFTAAIQLCKSWPKNILKGATIDATCGRIEGINEAGDSYIIASPRDQNGCASIRLNYESKIPISIVLNKSAMGRYDNAFEFIWLLLSTDFQLTAALLDHYCFMKNEPLS